MHDRGKKPIPVRERDVPPSTPRQFVEIAWITGLLIFAVAAMSDAVHRPWLFAGLGPSAYLYALYPRHPETRLYNTVAGHFLGIAAGIGVVLALRMSGELSPELARIFGAVLAVMGTVLLQLLLKAYHAPAASTALLFALGAIPPDIYSASRLAAGVILLALFGTVLKWLRRVNART